MTCAKQEVRATVVTHDGRQHFSSTNYARRPQTACPRAGMPTGVGYELCKSVCDQPAHAEVNALRLAGRRANGGTLYIEGHTYACESCKAAAREAGIVNIVFGRPPQ